MSLAFLVYIISVVPSIKAAAIMVFSVMALFVLTTLVNAGVNIDVFKRDDAPEVIKARAQISKTKKLFWPAGFLLSLMVLVPSKETLYTMLAAYGVEKVVENPVAQDLASDGVDVLRELMAKAKRELAEDKPKAEK